ncbi:MAG TPA: response regulator [Acidovorax sp.]|nr:response regulator [Acidovorax sp.]
MAQTTVYVVDDCTDTSDSLAALLAAMGHRAVACYSAQDALALINNRKPDCVMLDIAMAGMDGLDFSRRLRERFGDDIILVAVTGTPPDDPLVQATFDTVDHYFEKPVTLAELRKLFPS